MSRRDELTTRLRASTSDLLAIEGLDESREALRYADGKWSVREVMAHIADIEITNAWRLMRALGEPGSAVEAMDENAWARRLDYPARPTAISVEMIRGARALVCHAIADLPDDVLDGHCLHPEKRRMTGWDWCDLIDAHGRHHLSQVRAALDGRVWTPPPPTEDSWKYLGTTGPSAESSGG